MTETLKATYQFILSILSMVAGLAVGASVLVLGFIVAIVILAYIGCLELSDHLERRKRKPITYR